MLTRRSLMGGVFFAHRVTFDFVAHTHGHDVSSRAHTLGIVPHDRSKRQVRAAHRYPCIVLFAQRALSPENRLI